MEPLMQLLSITKWMIVGPSTGAGEFGFEGLSGDKGLDGLIGWVVGMKMDSKGWTERKDWRDSTGGKDSTDSKDSMGSFT
jgi:hypothetical protein